MPEQIWETGASVWLYYKERSFRAGADGHSCSLLDSLKNAVFFVFGSSNLLYTFDIFLFPP
jgi:hypothetical protein